MSSTIGPTSTPGSIIFYIDTQNTKSFNTYDYNFKDLTGKYDFTATGGTWSTGSPTASYNFLPTGYLSSNTQFTYNSPILTFAMWIKMPFNVAGQTILQGGAQSFTEGYVNISRSENSNWLEYDYRTFTFQNDISAAYAVDIFVGFDNVWMNVHIVADYRNKSVKFYRNGVQFGTTQTMIGSPSTPTIPRTHYIGSSGGTQNQNRGEFAMMAAYSRALTDTEILNSYNSQKTRLGFS